MVHPQVRLSPSGSPVKALGPVQALPCNRLIYWVSQCRAQPQSRLVTAGRDHEKRIQAAETELIAGPGATPLLTAARGLHAWIDRGGERQAGRAALIRFWRQRRLLREPFPLTGTDALRADTPWALTLWIPAFLEALAKEAENGLLLPMTR